MSRGITEEDLRKKESISPEDVLKLRTYTKGKLLFYICCKHLISRLSLRWERLRY